MNRRKGFTLIELLVVIAIIALLMSIMMPALGMVKRMAQATVCLSNLKQWALCFGMFMDDNGDQTLGDQDWITPLEEYYKDLKLFLCPSAKKRGSIPDSGDNILGDTTHAWEAKNFEFDSGKVLTFLGSYGFNYWANQHGAADPGDWMDKELWRRSTTKRYSQAPILTDSAKVGFAALPTDTPGAYDGDVYFGGTDFNEIRSACIKRHPGFTVNVLFGDYSVRKVNLKGLWYLRWYQCWPEQPPGNPVPPPVWTDYEWLRGCPEPN